MDILEKKCVAIKNCVVSNKNEHCVCARLIVQPADFTQTIEFRAGKYAGQAVPKVVIYIEDAYGNFTRLSLISRRLYSWHRA